MLASRVYIGEHAWGGVIVKNEKTAIVDPGTFESAQEILQATAERTRRRARRPDIAAAEPWAYYLRGLVFCGCCTIEETGDPYRMSGRDAIGRSTPVRYYECLRHVKYREGACSVKRVNADALHRAIIREIGLMVAHPWRVRKHIEAAALLMPNPAVLGSHLESARRRLRTTGRRLDNLTEAIATGGSRVVAAVSRAIMEAEAEREILEAEVRRLSAEYARAKSWRPDIQELQDTLGAFCQLWEFHNDERRSTLLPLLIDRVDMKSRQEARVVIHPNLFRDFSLPVVKDLVGRCDSARSGRLSTKPPSSVPPLVPSSPLPILVRIDSARIRDKVAA